MKKISLFLGIALISLVVASCGSSKKVAQQQQQKPQNQPENIPCPECIGSNGGVFKYLANDVAKSDMDIQFSRDAAASQARVNLAGMTETFVESVTDNFAKRYREDVDSKTIQSLTQQSKTAVKRAVQNAPITCWGTTPSTNGTMVWVCVELAPESIYQAMETTFSQDKELKIDFEREQFNENFYKTLEDFGKNR